MMEKFFGIYLLEKLKYLILDDFKLINSDIENLLKEFDGIENSLSNSILENEFIISKLNFYKESISNIKNTYEHDTLSIVINGYKTITVFSSDNKKSTPFSLMKNTGIVLSNKTITSEKIGSRSIIIDIVSKKDTLNIEK